MPRVKYEVSPCKDNETERDVREIDTVVAVENVQLAPDTRAATAFAFRYKYVLSCVETRKKQSDRGFAKLSESYLLSSEDQISKFHSSPSIFVYYDSQRFVEMHVNVRI